VVHTGVWQGNLRERLHLEDPNVDEDNIKMDLQEVGWGRYWIGLALNGGRWRAIVNAEMNLRIP
jgi:nitrogen fixation protein FixH